MFGISLVMLELATKGKRCNKLFLSVEKYIFAKTLTKDNFQWYTTSTPAQLFALIERQEIMT